MDTIIIRSNKKTTSNFILEMAKQIRVEARILKKDDVEDAHLNKLLLQDEKNLQEVEEDVIYKTLRKHGAKI